MEFVFELIKQHQKTKDVRLGIGIDKSVLSAHTDTWVEMVAAYLWMTPAQHGIKKGFAILAIRVIKFQMEFVFSHNKQAQKIKDVRDGTGISKFAFNAQINLFLRTVFVYLLVIYAHLGTIKVNV